MKRLSDPSLISSEGSHHVVLASLMSHLVCWRPAIPRQTRRTIHGVQKKSKLRHSHNGMERRSALATNAGAGPLLCDARGRCNTRHPIPTPETMWPAPGGAARATGIYLGSFARLVIIAHRKQTAASGLRASAARTQGLKNQTLVQQLRQRVVLSPQAPTLTRNDDLHRLLISDRRRQISDRRLLSQSPDVDAPR